MRQFCKPQRLAALIFTFLVGLWPICALAQQFEAVDEPVGARYSLGLTLWHMGHNAGYIERFHRFLAQRGQSPQSLLPAAALNPPREMQQILIEPELLDAMQRGGWKSEGEYLTNLAEKDSGVPATLPIHIERAGLFRLWISYYNWPDGIALSSLKIYRAGREDDAPLVSDEIYNAPQPQEGPAWKDLIVDFTPGDYVVKIGNLRPQWQAGEKLKAAPLRCPRRIDCAYITEELWAAPPTPQQRALLRASPPDSAARWTTNVLLPAEQQETWRWWQLRPLSWEERGQSRLFAFSREFWREQVDALAANGEGNLRDYRQDARQIIFDDVWNLIANPVVLRRRIAELKKSVGAARNEAANESATYILQAGDFQRLAGSWQRYGHSLRAGYGNFSGTAGTDLRVERPGRYQVWVRFANRRDLYAPWRATIQTPAQRLSFDHDKSNYDNEWQRIGALIIAGPTNVNFEIAPLPYQAPATFRTIHEFLLTTQEDFVPVGEAHPPMSRADYQAHARGAGATAADRYLAWFCDDFYRAPLSHDAWDSQNWPNRAVSGKSVIMPGETQVSVPIGLRNLTESPLTLSVGAQGLNGAGGSFPGKVSWRVVGFVPYAVSAKTSTGTSLLEWSPFALLRRPGVTIPPLNVAGIWLTVDSRGVLPGQYTARVNLSSADGAKRTLTFEVRVSSVRPTPRQPILAGGYTQPPAGEVYARDYDEHGLNIWYSPLSKAEMQRRGIRLLMLSVNDTAREAMSTRIQNLRQMGLSYDDFVFTVRDEPKGGTPELLKNYLDTAQAIRQADPRARISFNPGEAATLATFQLLDPLCDFWMPYVLHLSYPPKEAATKRAIYSAKPWMWYSTPCYQDKSPQHPAAMFDQFRAVAAQPANCRGSAFFAFYYPFRDAWDTANEYLPDASVHILPSRFGPVATIGWEAIREGITSANLAQMVKERSGNRPDAALQHLMTQGSTAELLQWLEINDKGAPVFQP